MANHGKKSATQLNREIDEVLQMRQRKAAAPRAVRTASSPGLPSQAEYERRELQGAHKRLEEIQRAPPTTRPPGQSLGQRETVTKTAADDPPRNPRGGEAWFIMQTAMDVVTLVSGVPPVSYSEDVLDAAGQPSLRIGQLGSGVAPQEHAAADEARAGGQVPGNPESMSNFVPARAPAR